MKHSIRIFSTVLNGEILRQFNCVGHRVNGSPGLWDVESDDAQNFFALGNNLREPETRLTVGEFKMGIHKGLHEMRVSILQCLADGLTEEEIAAKIFRTRQCVAAAILSLRTMNNCRTKYQLLSLAFRNKLIS